MREPEKDNRKGNRFPYNCSYVAKLTCQRVWKSTSELYISMTHVVDIGAVCLINT